ncbi:Signal transduction histidine kinase [Chitinophaga costaii]|uniref:histidine kinase n=1 Tax=Chitinophaga costaii TaxID=1335309 RepID=A0A1C4EP71_9BACT|nr:HAMP domain-containing sensor histidine kinase [Chitinophaga costaii]PUZ22480.1 sensor histidine kinase [Chitinophaga costaii]SCC45312.1 Signal transduction histidine kinase [Chitinophaga costaii]
MRLLTKTTLYFSLLLLPLIAGTGFLLYWQLKRQLKHEIDEELNNDSQYWKAYFSAPNADLAVLDIHTQPFDITPLDKTDIKSPFLKDVMLYQEIDHERVPFRQRQEIINIGQQPYLLTLRRSMIEKGDWYRNISMVMFFICVALLGCILLVNWVLSRRIWKPFYATLENMQQLQLDTLALPALPQSSTKEFQRLQAALQQMTTRIHHDFQAMKSLTEDAAHEMQTPLAIAQQQLELLLQDPAIAPEQGHAILQTSEALQRLSRLTNSLLFLAKIENNQYIAAAPIALETIIEKYTQLFDLQLQEQHLSLQFQLKASPPLPLHPILADTLISNLLGNAIKYNMPQGRIFITLDKAACTFRNTSLLPPLPVTNNFERFKKYHAYPNHSNGLGLAIVQRICEAHGWQLTYRYEEGMHVFVVHFVH